MQLQIFKSWFFVHENVRQKYRINFFAECFYHFLKSNIILINLNFWFWELLRRKVATKIFAPNFGAWAKMFFLTTPDVCLLKSITDMPNSIQSNFTIASWFYSSKSHNDFMVLIKTSNLVSVVVAPNYF